MSGERAEHTDTFMEVFHRVKQEQKGQPSFPQYGETKCKADEILPEFPVGRAEERKVLKSITGHRTARQDKPVVLCRGSIARLDAELLQPTKLAKPHCLNGTPQSLLLPACQLRDPPAIWPDCLSLW